MIRPRIHKRLGQRHARGSVLVVTVIGLLVLAALTFALTRQGALDSNIAASEVRNPRLRYAAEAAFVMAKDSVEAAFGCTGYTNLAATTFGNATVTATVSPASGSPVTITATATDANGGSYAVTRDVDVLTAITLVDQRGATAVETYIADTIPTTNLDNARQLMAADHAAGEKRSLLQWDFSKLPAGATISSAELELNVEAVSSGLDETVRVHRLTQGWVDDEASWNEHDTGQAWATAGGDYDSGIVASATANGASPTPVQWDLSSLARDWATGGAEANLGALLSTPSAGARVEFSSGNAAACSAYPKMTMVANCPCGDTCSFGGGPYPAITCDPAFIAEKQSSEFDYGLFANNVPDMEYIPECWTINGVNTPPGGAWLINEGGILSLRDMSGTMLTSLPVVGTVPTGVALIRSGPRANHIALGSYGGAKIRFLDLNGTVRGDISTAAFNDNPRGLAFIDNSASSTYDGYIAAVTDHNPGGGNHGRVYIIDQLGNLAVTIDVNAQATRPRGVAHLPGTDKLLVTDWWTHSAMVFDFAGTHYGTYNVTDLTGAFDVEGASFNPVTCEHVISSTFDDWFVGVSGASSACVADVLPNTQIRQYSTDAYDGGYQDGRTYLPAGTSVNGAAVLAGGAWLAVDRSETTTLTLDVNGNVLDNTLDIGINSLRGAAYIAGGAYQGRLAVISDGKILYYVHLSTGATISSIDLTGVLLDKAAGLSYISDSASGTYDDHLIIADDTGGLTIVDQAGNPVTTIDISPISTTIEGIAHLAGTDRFAVVDTSNSRVITVDLGGNLLKSYTHTGFGLDSARSIAVNGETCDHTLGGETAASTASVIDVSFVDGNTSPSGTYRDRFPMDKDSYAIANSSTNYGTDPEVSSGKRANKFRHAFVQSDLTTIPPTGGINFARLYLFLDYTWATATTPYDVHRVTEAWDENSMHWNSWSSAGGTYDASATDTLSVDLGVEDVWHSWDVGSLIMDWTNSTFVNYGVAIIPGSSVNNRQADFSSREDADAEQRPYFDVEWTVP